MIILGRLLQPASNRIIDLETLETKQRFEIITNQRIDLPVGSLVQVDITEKNGIYSLNNIYLRAEERDSSKIVLNEIFTEKQIDILLKHFYTETSLLDMALNDWLQFEEEVRLNTKGIGPKTLKKAKEKLKELMTPNEYEKDLSDYDFTLDEIMSISRFLQGRPFDLIKKEPYTLTSIGLPFNKVDNFAKKYCHIESDSPKRLKSALLYVLEKGHQKGHLFLYQNKNHPNQLSLIDEARVLVGKNQKRNLHASLKSMIEYHEVVHDMVKGEDVIYGSDYYNQEVRLARSISSQIGVDRKYRRNKTSYENQTAEIIKNFEKRNFKLDKTQKEAIPVFLENQMSILTGPPGSGKTTIIELMLTVYKELFPKSLIACAAPTGKAAERMTELLEPTGLQASTIHRLLKPQPWGDEFNFFYNRENKLPYDLLVFDEVSMISYKLMQAILDAISPGTKILMVGDEQQLSSIEPGSLLMEMINANNLVTKEEIIPKTVLTEIFRQKEGSSLKERSVNIRDGKGLSFSNSEDFKFYNIDSSDFIIEEILDFSKKMKNKNARLKDWTILTSMNVGELGVDRLNDEIQNVINPDGPGKGAVSIRKEGKGLSVFREGDKIIQLKNNNKLGIVNGSIGQIRQIMSESVYVDFIEDEDWVELRHEDLKDVQLAYAMTIHKSQGSEYNDVFLVLPSEHSHMMTKQLVYTAITRVKNNLIIVGNEKTIKESLLSENEIVQFSALGKRLDMVRKDKD